MIAKRMLQRDSELLLVGYSTDQVHGATTDTSENLWNLLVEVDALQADVAGASSWRYDQRGSDIRDSMSDRARQLATIARGLDEIALSERLARLAVGLDEFDGKGRGRRAE